MKVNKAHGASRISLDHKWKTDSVFMFHTSTGKLVVHVKSEKRRSKLSGYVEHANCLVHTNCLRPLCFTRCQKPVQNGPLWQNNCEGEKKGVRKVGTEWKTARTNVFHSSACVSLPNARLSGMMHGDSSARRQRRLKKKKKKRRQGHNVTSARLME